MFSNFVKLWKREKKVLYFIHNFFCLLFVAWSYTYFVSVTAYNVKIKTKKLKLSKDIEQFFCVPLKNNKIYVIFKFYGKARKES